MDKRSRFGTSWLPYLLVAPQLAITLLFFLLLAQFSIIQLGSLYTSVAVNVSVAVLVPLGFWLRRHPLERRQQTLGQQRIDLVAIALRSE